jgi:hypothetical protein
MSSRAVWFSLTLSWVLMAGPALSQESASDTTAQDEATTKPDGKVDQATESPWYKKLGWQWGGYLKGKTSVSWPSDNSYLSAVSNSPLLDGNTEFRLKNTTNFGQRFSLETHFESILAGGDTRSRSSQLLQVDPYLGAYALEQIRPVDDRRRLMDLTAVSQGEAYILSNRLDRLVLTYKPDWGFVRVGRQAVTWGNGMLFTPLDIFDPFAPTDIEREYKIGEDMLSVQVPSRWGEFQFLGVARREPLTHSVQLNQSSFAGKWHKGLGKVDLDLMAARHFSDDVIGFGSSQPLGRAGWRLDATWTFLDGDSRRAGYLALVTNIDYSWVWRSKNFYGYVEFYFNGLGTTHYDLASLDPALVARLARREMFTIGRYYADSKVQVEVNPLFNVYVSSIVNLYDGSGVFQPRGIYSITTDLLLTFGANLVWGKPGTEFGGIEIPTTQCTNRAAAGVFVWLSYYF